MKNVLITLLIFCFLFIIVPQAEKAEAGNDVYPVEIAVPDQPLIAGEETNFYIIVNDEKIKDEISYFMFYLGSGDKEGAKLDYAGENYLKFSDKLPNYSYANKLQLKIEAFSDSQEKYLFRVYKNTDYVLKYPFGPLPAKFDSGIEESLKKKNLHFVDIKSNYKEGEYKGMGYSDMYILENFDADFSKNLSKEEILKRVEQSKSFGSLVGAPFQDVPIISSEEIAPIDEMIDRVYLITGYNSMISREAHYYCEAIVIVVLNNADSDDQKIYPISMRKRAGNIPVGEYQGQIDEFIEMAKNFAKNITMRKYPEKEVEDLKQIVSVSNNMNPHPVFKEYNLDGELRSSDVYNQIMAGNEPGIKAPEKKEMDDRKYEISFRYDNEATIWNTGIVNTGTEKDTSFSVSVNIDIKALDKDGKEIEVSDEELYKDVYLFYEIVNPKSQIMFQENPDGNSLKSKVDDVIESQYLQSKGPIRYTGPYLPTEYVSVYLANKDGDLLTGRYLYRVHMKDASPRIEMEKNIKEIDDVNDGVFKFKINDDFHEKAECSVKIPYEKYLANKIPIIKISTEGSGDDLGTYIEPFECETNKWITIRVRPPKLGNFNMLSELNGLNMWDLQRGTMESFATDLVGFAVDRRMASLKKSSKAMSSLYEKGYTKAKGALERANKIEQTRRFLDKANGIAGHAQNAIKLTQMSGNLDTHSKDFDKATEIKGAKTLTESAYDWGIGGINILQSTVGAVAMAPGHIPFVGKYAQKVTGTFSLVFNLMTNAWKGNLEYLSKEKKIDRAQEKNIPYPALVGVSTKEGFSDTSAQVISVLYTYVE